MSRFLGVAAPLPAPTAVSVGTSAALLVQKNQSRQWLYIQNNGALDIYISPSPEVTVSTGVLIPAAGGALLLTALSDGACVGVSWFAVSPAAGATAWVCSFLSPAADGSEGV